MSHYRYIPYKCDQIGLFLHGRSMENFFRNSVEELRFFFDYITTYFLQVNDD